jgi:hypothetical protein
MAPKMASTILNIVAFVVLLWYNAFFKGRILWLFKKCALFRYCFVLSKREIVILYDIPS